MSFTVETTTQIDDVANFIVFSILKELKLDNKVLLFLTGGSSITVGVKIAEILRNNKSQDLIKNLTITLTDERYGDIGHKDSNWQQLLDKGFNISNAKLIPILSGDDIYVTTKKFNKKLEEEFKNADYKIGLFGIGKDGHTAGILPETGALDCKDLVFGYDTLTFSRITMTPKAIEKLDEAIAWVQGEDKWGIIENLDKNIPARNDSHSDAGGDIIKQPAQILKKVPLLTIFTDYKKI